MLQNVFCHFDIRVIKNCEQLALAEKMSVSTTTFNHARAIPGAGDDEDRLYRSANLSSAPHPKGIKYRDQNYTKVRNATQKETYQ